MTKRKKTGGRQKGSKNILSTDIKYLAQQYGQDAIEVLYGLMMNSRQDMVKLNAAKEILNRGFGTPAIMELPKDDDGKATPVMVKVQVLDGRNPDAAA